MSHPMYNLHVINDLVESIRIDLLDVNDNKSTILKTVKHIQKNITELRDNYNSEKMKLEQEQQLYFDEVLFEFSEDNQFEKSITRQLRGYLLDMQDIDNWIKAERRLQNKNDAYLHARIILTDYDCEDIPDSEKIED